MCPFLEAQLQGVNPFRVFQNNTRVVDLYVALHTPKKMTKSSQTPLPTEAEHPEGFRKHELGHKKSFAVPRACVLEILGISSVHLGGLYRVCFICHALGSGFAGISSVISSEYWSWNLQFRLAPREANIQDVVGCEMADLVAHEADLSDARLTMTVKQSENVAMTIVVGISSN